MVHLQSMLMVGIGPSTCYFNLVALSCQDVCIGWMWYPPGLMLLEPRNPAWSARILIFWSRGMNVLLARVYVAWEPYRDHIPAEERDDFVAAYSKRLNSTDESVQVFHSASHHIQWVSKLDVVETGASHLSTFFAKYPSTTTELFLYWVRMMDFIYVGFKWNALESYYLGVCRRLYADFVLFLSLQQRRPGPIGRWQLRT